MDRDYDSFDRKYVQIRVKSIKFHEKSAIAIYFYDVTHHIESRQVQQNGEIHLQASRHEQLETIMVSKFRARTQMILGYLQNIWSYQAMS